jgi:hypothetical protein
VLGLCSGGALAKPWRSGGLQANRLRQRVELLLEPLWRSLFVCLFGTR